jgi:SpoVK/Ycf46/Vps4 family AAA+-type ATPase
VNKYLGDTEKSLDTIFTAAVATAAALFFDEADALFGKRSEVRDAHDRYANLEINYPRQRIETSHGLIILATTFTVLMVLGLCLIPRGGRPKG